jgi:hypothetical protein
MHIQQDTNSASNTTGQAHDVHIASSLHDPMPESDHDASHHNRHVAEVNISADSLVKKIELLGFFSLLFFVISMLLYKQQAVRLSRPDIVESRPPTSLYLLHPPLRAPPR